MQVEVCRKNVVPDVDIFSEEPDPLTYNGPDPDPEPVPVPIPSMFLK